MQIALAVVLASGATFAMVRYWRSGAPHRLVLALLQPLVAVLLYVALAGPERTGSGDALAVVTAGTTSAQRDALLRSGIPVVVLPEADADARFEPAPDLATALRRHPGVERIAVHGIGLVARDRDAARGRVRTFDAAPARPGLVEIPEAVEVAAGRDFILAGRVAGVTGATVELRDPADAIVASAAPSSDGRFALAARSRQPGAASWRLRVLDASAREVDAYDAPVDVVEAPPLRVGVLAGSASPELKYLRRWIRDAGYELRSRLGLGGGVEVSDAPLSLAPEALASLDVLVVDERGWLGASAAERAGIAAATRDGLGLLLRATASVPSQVADDWRSLGLEVVAATDVASDGDQPATTTRDSTTPRPPGSAAPAGEGAPPALLPLSIRAQGSGLIPIPHSGAVPGWWRAHGRGRVALWRLADTHRLVTTGHAAQHHELWASALETVARPRGVARPRLVAPARVGERAILCGLDGDPAVAAPGGSTTRLVAIDRCAAYWPLEPGWHSIEGAAAARFHVLRADQAPAWVAARTTEATTLLVSPADDSVARERAPTPRWAWLAEAFAVLAGCWLLERRALGSDDVREA